MHHLPFLPSCAKILVRISLRDQPPSSYKFKVFNGAFLWIKMFASSRELKRSAPMSNVLQCFKPKSKSFIVYPFDYSSHVWLRN